MSLLAPTGACGADEFCACRRSNCGSEPARDGGGAACIHTECAAAIASKLCSHRSDRCTTRRARSAARPPSRASSHNGNGVRPGKPGRL
ncbi:hypothetical protein C0J56_17350 [Pseudomonas fluorescens]|nr:hypothetical protein C0J56_17350 [Pseudomonas fluorescens]